MTAPKDRTWQDYVRMAEDALISAEICAQDYGKADKRTHYYLRYARTCVQIGMAKKEMKR